MEPFNPKKNINAERYKGFMGEGRGLCGTNGGSSLPLQNSSKLKLQAAMEGTSHPAPPTGGFRKTGNGKQYAFKKVNIEERVIVIYMCQTCCQLVALCP